MTHIRTLSAWSESIKSRDVVCTQCKATTGLVAHHIRPKSQYPELKYKLDNGVTLCVDCHRLHHKDNPVTGIGVGVVGKVAMRKTISELQKKLSALENNGKHRCKRCAILEERNANLKAANVKLRKSVDN